MSFSADEEMLTRAARRAAKSSTVLLASLLEEWSRAFGADAGEALGLDRRRVDELALCRRPRADHWLTDVGLLAGEFGVARESLISLLRAAEAAESFRYAHPEGTDVSGRLLAARDRDEEDDR
jgi:hypothetical protein